MIERARAHLQSRHYVLQTGVGSRSEATLWGQPRVIRHIIIIVTVGIIMSEESLKPVQALVFDLIGTTTDWKTPVAASLKAHAVNLSSGRDWDEFAHEWRTGFFSYVSDLASKGQQKPVNEVYKAVLTLLLNKHGINEWGEEEQADLIKGWKMMQGTRFKYEPPTRTQRQREMKHGMIQFLGWMRSDKNTP